MPMRPANSIQTPLAASIILLVSVLAPGGSAAGERLSLVGGPFEIRSAFTDFNPHYLAVSRARDSGSFVAVWDESPIGFWTVHARRFGASGEPLDSGPIEVSPAGSTFVYAPAQVASDAAGGFLVAWSGRSGTEPWSILGRRYGATGLPLSAATPMNAPTSAFLDEPTVAMAADGRSVAAWSDGTNGGVWFQAYDPAGGAALAGDQSLPMEGVGRYDFFAPAVSMDPQSGAFVIVRRTRQGPSPASPTCANSRFGVDLVGQIYSASGEPIGAPFYPLPPQAGGYRLPLVSLAPLGNGEFVAAWALGSCTGTAPVAPTARVVHADGTLSAPFALSTAGAAPSVAADASGRFAAAWIGATGAMVRRFDRTGAPLGEEVLAVPADVSVAAGSPLLASDGVGRIVLAWQTSRDVATTYGTATEHRILGQLLTPEVVRHVRIDIRPGSTPNTVNLGSNGVVPVAILSDEAFDATTVDATTVRLASAQVRLRGNGTPMASVYDVDGDGLADLVVHVSTSALTLTASDTTATLEASTADGQRIEGVDSVRVVN